MKKILLASFLFLVPFAAFARGYPHQRHNPAPTPPPVPTPTPVSGIQFGMYNNEQETKYGTWTGFFFGDGDDFDQDLASGHVSGPVFAYWESGYTATQIENGVADPFLKTWASEMKAYPYPIIFAPLDEMNGNWSVYYGNPTAYIAAWKHVYGLFSGDSNIEFAYDPNVSGPGIPLGSLTSYYPGSAYVSIVGLDGFDFGGQTWSQVFSASLPTMEGFDKPLWITSEGVIDSDNQSAFLEASFAAPVQGIMYFNQSPFSLTSSAISTLQSLL